MENDVSYDDAEDVDDGDDDDDDEVEEEEKVDEEDDDEAGDIDITRSVWFLRPDFALATRRGWGVNVGTEYKNSGARIIILLP